jgi:hypothetical protein
MAQQVIKMTFKLFLEFNSRKFGFALLHEKQFASSEFKHKLFIHFLWFEIGVKFLQ